MEKNHRPKKSKSIYSLSPLSPNVLGMELRILHVIGKPLRHTPSLQSVTFYTFFDFSSLSFSLNNDPITISMEFSYFA